jgi:hypothetical protein
MNRSGFSLVALVAAALLWSSALQAQHHNHGASDPLHTGHDSRLWEGSPEGKAYSEFNHHLAGALVLLMGFSELGGAFSIAAVAWSRFVLPMAMLAAGLYLLGWSDHEAWPIGSFTFRRTFLGGDLEILQHKVYAFFLLGVGGTELLRRAGKIKRPTWAMPLPLFAILGGIVLFLHQHSEHPGTHKIAMHHMVMGAMAVSAGACKLAGWSGVLRQSSSESQPDGWDRAWAALLLAIGMALVVYSE